MAGREPEFSMETVDGRTLRVGRWRAPLSTRPPLFFFNGIGANIELVAPAVPLLGDREFVTFDMPGIGGSPDPVVPYNAVTMAHAADRLLGQLGLSKVDVFGVSWGGAMAQHFAFQHPSRVRRLVLAATSPGMLMVPGRIEALSKMADPRRYVDASYMRRHFTTMYGGSTEGKGGHIGRITPPTRRGYFYQLLALAGWTSLPLLPLLRAPTLVMMGADDPIVPVVNGRILARMIPNAELAIFEDGGHLFMLSHAEEAMAKVTEFLDRPEPATRAKAA